MSNFNMCWFSIFGACFEFVVGGLVWFGQSIIFNFRRVPVVQKVVARVPHPIKDFLPGLNLPRRAGEEIQSAEAKWVGA